MGIWVQAQTLHLELAKAAGELGIPGFLDKNPVIFVPAIRLEWLMAAAKSFPV